MKNLEIALEHRPGALAAMGEALGRAGVSIEGGGVFVANGAGVAHTVQYSDHVGNLILAIDDFARGQVVSEQWKRDCATA